MTLMRPHLVTVTSTTCALLERTLRRDPFRAIHVRPALPIQILTRPLSVSRARLVTHLSQEVFHVQHVHRALLILTWIRALRVSHAILGNMLLKPQ